MLPSPYLPLRLHNKHNTTVSTAARYYNRIHQAKTVMSETPSNVRPMNHILIQNTSICIHWKGRQNP